VDLDINGTANSVRLEEVELVQANLPWSVPAPGAPANESAATPTKSLRRSTPETEDGAAVPYAAGGTTAFAVVNERALNRWGDARGYRVQARARRRRAAAAGTGPRPAPPPTPAGEPAAPATHAPCLQSRRARAQVDATIPQLAPDGYAPAVAAPWARLRTAASVRRDDEPASSSIFAAAQPAAGLAAANFSAIVNGEPLRGTDVVAWVTLGAWDLPSAESAPALATPGRRRAPPPRLRICMRACGRLRMRGARAGSR
jgi:hypothetical protein